MVLTKDTRTNLMALLVSCNAFTEQTQCLQAQAQTAERRCEIWVRRSEQPTAHIKAPLELFARLIRLPKSKTAHARIHQSSSILRAVLTKSFGCYFLALEKLAQSTLVVSSVFHTNANIVKRDSITRVSRPQDATLQLRALGEHLQRIAVAPHSNLTACQPREHSHPRRVFAFWHKAATHQAICLFVPALLQAVLA